MNEQEIMDAFEEDLLTLFEKGLISVTYDWDLNATVALTEKGERHAQVLKDIYLD